MTEDYARRGGRGVDVCKEGGDTALFKDDFLNKNPILMEYMAQAALEEIDGEEEVGGEVGDRWAVEEEDDEVAVGACVGDDEIKFIDIQTQSQTSDITLIKGVRDEAHAAAHVRGEEEEESCLSRSETSRPVSRARRCGSFAADLRAVASTMSGV